jgi:hypothetical protein
MKFNPRGLLVTVVEIALISWLALRTHAVSTFDFVFGIILWAVVMVLSVAMVVGTAGGRSVIGQGGALWELRR